MTTMPKPPDGTGPTGRRLWRAVLEDYELAEHEMTLLREVVRTLDALDALDAEIRSTGAMVESPQGRKTNPALVEARHQRITLARLLTALRVPLGDQEGDDEAKPQRRALRGVYALHGA